jgi:amino acid adenylation domain-containing protein
MVKHRSLATLITSAFNQFSSNIAFEMPGDELLSYAKTQSRSLEIAAFLKAQNLNPQDRIILCADKSLDSLTCVFGIILSGSVYLPVDNQVPEKRIRHIVEESCSKGIIFEKQDIKRLASIEEKITQITPIPNTSLSYASLQQAQHIDPMTPKNLAYILYTSGSSGVPKGVMITQKNALSFIEWAATNFDLSECDIFSSVAPLHFDLSIFDVFVALWHGAKVILLDNKTIRNPLMLSELIQQKKISVWYSTPTILMLLLRYGKLYRYDHQSLRIVNYAGEVFPKEQLVMLKEHWTNPLFYNLYGPTETNVCTYYPVPTNITNEFSSSTIGKSCKYVICKILSEDLIIMEALAGGRGELIVSGDSVTPGYLKPSKNEKSKFFKDENEQIWYKTGDFVKVNSNEEFEFVGRKDQMIKRNGYRIDLGELEQVITQSNRVDRVVIVNHKHKERHLLRAFLVSKKSEDQNTPYLKNFVAKYLPAYMIPDEWVWIDEMPITSTQKIDHNALAKHALT